MIARLMMVGLVLALSGCGATGPRIAPVDEVGVGNTGSYTPTPVVTGGGAATSDTAASAAASNSPGVVVSTLPGDGRTLAPRDEAAVAAPRPSPAQAKTPPMPPPGELAPAVVALVGEADRRAGAGQHDSAAATIERALQVSPRNAWLWHRLARERLAQGRAGEAENLATRSTSLAPSDPALQAGNWRVIEQARRSLGDERGASEARRRAERLESGTA